MFGANRNGKDGGRARAAARELVENLREMLDEAEQVVIRTASDQAGEAVERLRNRLQGKLDELRTGYQQAEDRVEDLVSAVDREIRSRPYRAIGIAAAAGILAGILLSRKR